MAESCVEVIKGQERVRVHLIDAPEFLANGYELASEAVADSRGQFVFVDKASVMALESLSHSIQEEKATQSKTASRVSKR